MLKILSRLLIAILAVTIVATAFSINDADASDVAGEYAVFGESEDNGGEYGYIDPLDEEIAFNLPVKMSAIHLVSGEDILTAEATNDDLIRAEIDKALAQIEEYEFNTVIIDSTYDGKALFNTDSMESAAGFDILAYIIDRFQTDERYVFVNHNIFAALDGAVSAATIDKNSALAVYITENYDITGMTLENIYNEKTDYSYQNFRAEAVGMELDSWMQENSYNFITSVVRDIRTVNKTVAVGAFLNPVWEYSEAREEGIEVTGDFSALSEGNTDTKKLVSDGILNYIFIDNYASLSDDALPFETVLSWWDAVATQAEIPMFLYLSNSKLGGDEDGWSSPDQILRQLSTADEYASYRGSALNSISSLLEDYQGSTEVLIKYFRGEVDNAQLFTNISIYQPTQTNFVTYEDKVVFFGVTDGNFPSFVNDVEISPNANGEFSQTVDLEVGDNTIVFENKGQRLTYNIERRIDLLKSVTPTGTASVGGSTKLSVTAVAYKGSTVTASLGGSSITLTETIDDGSATSLYTTFVGEFTIPASTSSVQNLGTINFNASWSGHSEGMSGASISVNAVIDTAIPGEAIIVTADRAEVFPITTADDLSAPINHHLPKGTVDYVVGSVTYPTASKTYAYYILKSGKRVYTWDVTKIEDPGYENSNAVHGVSVAVNGIYTDITVDTDWPVAHNIEFEPNVFNQNGSQYPASFNPTRVRIVLSYTNSVPQGGIDMSASPLFSSGIFSTEGSGENTVGVISLDLTAAGKMLGVTSFRDGNGDLVVRFTNIPSSISEARIYLDSGHGGQDPGATNGAYWEATLNMSITTRVAEILRGMGAEVRIFEPVFSDTSSQSLVRRAADARSWGAHIYVSLHHNSGSTTASGPEVFYYNPYSSVLSSNIFNSIAGTVPGSSTARGSKFSYNFYVTRNTDLVAVLIEYGFMSNQNELQYLIQEDIQQQFAQRTADAIVRTLSY